jgi:hypothetical protein
MFSVCRFLFFSRPLSRVENFERGSDDEHFAQRVFLVGGEEHSADARVDGQPAQRSSDARQFVVFVDGAKFVERFEPVVYGGSRGRVDERKDGDIAESERFRL